MHSALRLFLAFGLCPLGLLAQQAYPPQPVQVPPSASYLTHDGAIRIVGNDGWDALMSQFDELFLRTHPGFGHGFALELKGSSVATAGITMGVSAMAPMGRAQWENERQTIQGA